MGPPVAGPHRRRELVPGPVGPAAAARRRPGAVVTRAASRNWSLRLIAARPERPEDRGVPLTSDPSTAPTRIVLYDLPPLVGAIARRQIRADDGMTVVAEPGADADLRLVAAETRADLILALADHGELPPACAALVDQLADIRVVAVHGDVSGGLQWEFRPEQRDLDADEAKSLLGGAGPEAGG